MALILDLGFQEHAAETAYADASASNNDATFANALTAEHIAGQGPGGQYAWAPHGRILAAIGTWSLVDITITPTDARTFQGWFKRDTNADMDIWFYDGSAIAATYFEPGTDDVTVQDQTGTVGTLASGVDTTDWHYWGLVYKADNDIDLYADGSLIGTIGTRVDNLQISIGSAFLGRYAGWKVYDEVRSAGQQAADAVLSGGGGGGNRKFFLDLLGLDE
jgi:hypothetical protein